MCDYISRVDVVAAFEKVEDLYDPEWGNKRYTPDDVEEIINDVPAADVRPVVLCRDCRYSEKVDKDLLYCNTWDTWNVPTDGFCSFGECDKMGSNAPRLKRPDPCADCRWSPPSSSDGKPCCACDTDDPLLNCYQKREVSK